MAQALLLAAQGLGRRPRLLRRGQSIGRLDPKAHRKEGRFEVKALHLEPGVPITDTLVADLAGALRDIADWHSTPTVGVRRSDLPELALLVQRAVETSASAVEEE